MFLDPLNLLYPGGGASGSPSSLPASERARKDGRKLISLANFGGHTTYTIRNSPEGYAYPLEFVAANVRFPSSQTGPGGTRNTLMHSSITAADLAQGKADIIAIAQAGTLLSFFPAVVLDAPANWKWDDATQWSTFLTNMALVVQELILSVNSALGYEFVPGLYIEWEPYGHEIWRYDTNGGALDGMDNVFNNPNSLTKSSMESFIEEKGYQLAATICTLKGDMLIHESLGYVQCRYNNFYNSYPRYEMLQAWLNGWSNGVTPGTTMIELIQDSYGKTSAAQFLNNKNDSQYGWATLSAGVDYDTDNFYQREFCMSLWPDFHTRAVQTSTQATNTITLPQNYFAVNDIMWTPQTGERNITGVSGNQITYDGTAVSIPSGEIVLGYSPATIIEACGWIDNAASSRWIVVYYQGSQPHRNISSPPLFNWEILNALAGAVANKTQTPTIGSFSTDTDIIGDYTTTDSTITLSGSSVASATIEVFQNAASIGATTADGSGIWSFTSSALVPGIYTFEVTAQLATANVSDYSASMVIEVLPVPTWSATGINDFIVSTTKVLDLSGVFIAGCCLSPDGNSLYTAGQNGLTQWSLTTTGDISSGVLVAAETPTGLGTAQGITMSFDGTRVYACEATTDKIFEYSLSIPFDITSLAATGGEISHGNDPQGLFLKPDGTKLYVVDSGTDKVYRYTMATPNSIATAIADQEYTVLGETFPQDIAFTYDGLTMLLSGDTGNVLREYTLTTPWDISTGVTLTRSINTTVYAAGLQGIAMDWTQNNLYVIDAIDKVITQLER